MNVPARPRQGPDIVVRMGVVGTKQGVIHYLRTHRDEIRATLERLEKELEKEP